MTPPLLLLLLLLLLPLAQCAAAAPPLLPKALRTLPVGSVTPTGWLRRQLELQADGLSGHLSMFWNDVMDSVWVGGSGDGGLHERTPYWLNGVVPLSFLLENAQGSSGAQVHGVVGLYKKTKKKTRGAPPPLCANNTDMKYSDIRDFDTQSPSTCRQACLDEPLCVGFVVNACAAPQVHCWLKSSIGALTQNAPCRCFGTVDRPPVPVNMTAQVERYLAYILAHQGANGWLGPDSGSTTDGGQFWGPSNTLFALLQYSEGRASRGDVAGAANASLAVKLHLLEQSRRMKTAKLASWAAARWIDMALTAEWLLDNDDAALAADERQTLLELITMLHDDGSDWDGWFQTFTGDAGGHNVNNAQGLKSAAVWYRRNGSAALPQLSVSRMENMDARYGLPTGMYNGDELLPEPPTRSPSRGIELCGVVEAMFSYGTMLSVHGDPRFGDRVERIAYNALPATWASPTGGDMWAHQYLQAVNQINAVKADPHVWTHDGDMAETYGLEPNYGCCTANFNQGWPKFSHLLAFRRPQTGGIVVGVWAPVTVSLGGGATLEVQTDFPFGDSATVTVSGVKAGTPVELRIPAWADKATVDGAPVANGTFFKTAISGSGGSKPTASFQVEFNPAVRVEEWFNGAISVHRGALMYSLPIEGNYTVYGHHFGTAAQSNDYYMEPTVDWAYAIDLDDPAAPEKSLEFHRVSEYKAGSAPFNHTGWTVMVKAKLRAVQSGWGEVANSAAAPPAGPVCAGAPRGNGTWQCAPEAKEVWLVPHGGTDLRMGELPVSGY